MNRELSCLHESERDLQKRKKMISPSAGHTGIHPSLGSAAVPRVRIGNALLKVDYEEPLHSCSSVSRSGRCIGFHEDFNQKMDKR